MLHDNNSGTSSTPYPKLKSIRRKELYKELGLEDSNSCSNFGISECDVAKNLNDTEKCRTVTSQTNPSAKIRSESNCVEFASSLGVLISESSEDEDENDAVPSSQGNNSEATYRKWHSKICASHIIKDKI